MTDTDLEWVYNGRLWYLRSKGREDMLAKVERDGRRRYVADVYSRDGRVAVDRSFRWARSARRWARDRVEKGDD